MRVTRTRTQRIKALRVQCLDVTRGMMRVRWDSVAGGKYAWAASDFD